MEIGTLNDARKLISPLENRINFVEFATSLEKRPRIKTIGYHSLGFATSFIRGAAVFGTLAWLASGFNENAMYIGAFLGGSSDASLNAIRSIGLAIMKKTDSKDYENHLRHYKKILKINYGKYAI